MTEQLQSLRMDGHKGCVRSTCGYFTKGTIFSSIFNLLTTIVGAGTLALPFAFKVGGLIFSSVVFFVILMIAILTGLFLYDSQRICKDLFPSIEIKGYSDLAELTFGKIGRIVVMVTLLVLLYLTLVAYMIYTRDQLELIINFALIKTGHIPQCWIFHNCAIVMVLAFMPLFPVILLKKLSLLQFTSTISIICVVFVAVFVAISSGDYYSHNSNSTKFVIFTDSVQYHVGLLPHTIEGAITCVSYCSLCFLCHFQLFSVERELHRPKRWKLNFIIVASMFIAYSIYNVVAIAGYLQFGGDTNEDIMTNYPSKEILVTTARIALFLTLLFSYPVLFHPTRAVLNELCAYFYELCSKGTDVLGIQNPDTDEGLLLNSNLYWRQREKDLMYRKEVRTGKLVWFCETWILFSLTFLPAAIIPNVGYVWNFVGSIGGTLILYIFPPLFLLRLRYFINWKMSTQMGTSLKNQYLNNSLWKDIVSVAIITLGVVVLVAGNYSAIKAIIFHSHKPLSSCKQSKCFSDDNNSIAFDNYSSSVYYYY